MIRYEQVVGRGLALFVLTGCALTSCATTTQTRPMTSSPLVLSDAMLAEKKGDLDGLYKVWVQPLVPKNEDYIPLASKEQQLASVEAIKDGFGRFCAAGGGVMSTKPLEFGAEHGCADAAGAFAGRITVERMQGNMLYVTYDSPKRVAARAAAEQAFERRRAENGPTGWLTTKQGKVRFLRLGTLTERHIVEVEVENSGEHAPIEEIVRIDFHESCCDFDVKLKDGRTKTLNMSRLRHRSGPNVSSTYGAGKYGLPVVVVDAESGQPYTRLFSNLEGVKSIEPDPNAASWKTLPGGAMKTSFQLASQSGADRHTQQLRKRAKQLYAEATSNGSIKLLPDGKLTPQLSRHLESELNSLAHASACDGDEIAGVTDLEAYAQCRVAARELKLVIGAGYSLVTDVTPLSAIIVLEKINRDLR